LDEIEGQYDYVICNPPLGTRRGMAPGDQMCEGRCSKSEHSFLELCIRALKPRGQALVLAPYNYVDRLPKAARAWLDDHADVEHGRGPLPGKFALTFIKLHAWRFQRHDHDALATIYQRTAKRQHAPGGIMTEVEAEWARLNDPPCIPGPGEPIQLSLFQEMDQ